LPRAHRLDPEYCLAQRHQRLAPHRRCRAAEQYLNLMIVSRGRCGAEIAVALEMKQPAIISRVGFDVRAAQAALFRRTVAARLDGGEVGEEIDRAAQFGERIAAPILGRCVESGVDIAPVLVKQLAQVAEDAAAVGHRPTLEVLRQRHRL